MNNAAYFLLPLLTFVLGFFTGTKSQGAGCSSRLVAVRHDSTHAVDADSGGKFRFTSAVSLEERFSPAVMAQDREDAAICMSPKCIPVLAIWNNSLWDRHTSTISLGYPASKQEYVQKLALTVTGAEHSLSRDMNPSLRICGNDWPGEKGTTMIGLLRIRNIARVVLDAVSNGIEGDFLEAGVWKGGACIFARGLLNALGQTHRKVHLLDAFDTLEVYKSFEVAGSDKDLTRLAQTQDDVTKNFIAQRLYDPSLVQFHKGLFHDVLPGFYKSGKSNGLKIAVLRIDGNFYDSYQDCLYYLYEFVPIGGYVIFDDVRSHASVRRAWIDFVKDYGVFEELISIDRHSAYFKKLRDVKIDFAKMHGPYDVNLPPKGGGTR